MTLIVLMILSVKFIVQLYPCIKLIFHYNDIDGESPCLHIALSC